MKVKDAPKCPICLGIKIKGGCICSEADNPSFEEPLIEQQLTEDAIPWNDKSCAPHKGGWLLLKSQNEDGEIYYDLDYGEEAWSIGGWSDYVIGWVLLDDENSNN